MIRRQVFAIEIAQRVPNEARPWESVFDILCNGERIATRRFYDDAILFAETLLRRVPGFGTVRLDRDLTVEG